MEVAEYKTLPESYGNLNPARHFIARARGNSMNGGKTPIKDGAYLGAGNILLIGLRVTN